MRVLVAIANHGTKNHRHLVRVLDSYAAMSFDVDVVVLADQPRQFGPDVEVRVGAPTEDPRSLPFAHRQLFGDRVDAYDLFVYSEDDTLLEQRQLDAFVEVNSLLPADVVPGFLRYEERPSGERSYCSFHSIFRWDPASVRRWGDVDAARFSNAHSALYAVTRDQLRTAIASGEYLRPPHSGVYSQMVSAATDIYTRCGLTRVLCLDRIDDFLLHHLPNVYLDRLGITPHDFKLQLEALSEINEGNRSSSSLLPEVHDLPRPGAERNVFRVAPSSALRAAVGTPSRRVLSVGCTTGDLERTLFPDAAEIVGVPVDEVLGALARDRGVRTVEADLDRGLEAVSDQQFEAILVEDLLKHVSNPPALLERLGALLEPQGRIVATAPNGRRQRVAHRLGRDVPPPLPRSGSFAVRGAHHTDGSVLRSWFRTAGLDMQAEEYANHGPLDRWRPVPRPLGRWTGAQVVVVARRSGQVAKWTR